MKIIIILAAALIVLCLGGFLYVALADVHIAQNDVVKEIPHDRFNAAP
jgi:hypothetical protein